MSSLRYVGRVEGAATIECMDLNAYPLGYEIYLDGLLQKDVVSFDTERGELTRFKCDGGGHIIIAEDDNFATETLHGRVEVVLGDPDDPYDPPESLLRSAEVLG